MRTATTGHLRLTKISTRYIAFIFASVKPFSVSSSCLYFYPHLRPFQNLYHWLHQQKTRRYDQRKLDPRPREALSDTELCLLEEVGVVFGEDEVLEKKLS